MSDVIVMLTPAEAAERLGVSRHTVYDMCAVEDKNGDPKAPDLGHNRIGGRICIPESEVDALLAKTFVPAEVTSIEEHRHRSRQAA